MTSRKRVQYADTKESTLFSGQYLCNRSTLDMGVLGYIGIVWPKEHSPEVWSVPPFTPCIYCSYRRELKKWQKWRFVWTLCMVFPHDGLFRLGNTPSIKIVSSNYVWCQHTAIVFLFVCFWRNSPQWARASSFTRFLDHTQWCNTVSRTPLDEWSAHRRDLYLTKHNTHNRQTSVLPSGIRTHDLSRWVAADIRLRPCGHWDRQYLSVETCKYLFISFLTCLYLL